GLNLIWIQVDSVFARNQSLENEITLNIGYREAVHIFDALTNDSLNAKPDVRHWQSLFTIDNPSGGCKRLGRATKSDINVCGFASLTYLDNLVFILLGYIRVENLFVCRTSNTRRCYIIIVSAARRDFIA